MVPRRAHLLEFAVLGLLHEGPTHGYDLRRRLNEALGPFRALSYGTLYPALKSLLGRGLIAEAADPGRTGKRPRVVYELTASGKEHFADLVARTDSSAYEDEAFDVRFAFFARTESEVRLRILEGRRSRLEDDLARVRERSVRRRERLDTYTAALQQHGEEQTEREVRWLTELIDAERRHPTDPGPQP
ncbi:PadR family transcriptional regulator [Phycicoccus avicenniae]|uniref:PadR family transcriptional regulator n=1 Tax=Phycicoccus avicenniae TaxID=2828860 RepID=UPI003D278E9E